MSTSAPERTLRQRMDALARANTVRTNRAQVKRDLKAGRAELADLLLDEQPGDHLATAKVIDMLLAAPKIGRVKANKALVQARISPSKTLAGMTARQRAELVSRLLAR